MAAPNFIDLTRCISLSSVISSVHILEEDDSSTTGGSMLCIVDSSDGYSMSCHALKEHWQPCVDEKCDFSDGSRASIVSDQTLTTLQKEVPSLLCVKNSELLDSVSKTAQDLILDFIGYESNLSQATAVNYTKRKTLINDSAQSLLGETNAGESPITFDTQSSCNRISANVPKIGKKSSLLIDQIETKIGSKVGEVLVSKLHKLLYLADKCKCSCKCEVECNKAIQSSHNNYAQTIKNAVCSEVTTALVKSVSIDVCPATNEHGVQPVNKFGSDIGVTDDDNKNTTESTEKACKCNSPADREKNGECGQIKIESSQSRLRQSSEMIELKDPCVIINHHSPVISTHQSKLEPRVHLNQENDQQKRTQISNSSIDKKSNFTGGSQGLITVIQSSQIENPRKVCTCCGGCDARRVELLKDQSDSCECPNTSQTLYLNEITPGESSFNSNTSQLKDTFSEGFIYAAEEVNSSNPSPLNENISHCSECFENQTLYFNDNTFQEKVTYSEDTKNAAEGSNESPKTSELQFTCFKPYDLAITIKYCNSSSESMQITSSESEYVTIPNQQIPVCIKKHSSCVLCTCKTISESNHSHLESNPSVYAANMLKPQRPEPYCQTLKARTKDKNSPEFKCPKCEVQRMTSITANPSNSSQSSDSYAHVMKYYGSTSGCQTSNEKIQGKSNTQSKDWTTPLQCFTRSSWNSNSKVPGSQVAYEECIAQLKYELPRPSYHPRQNRELIYPLSNCRACGSKIISIDTHASQITDSGSGRERIQLYFLESEPSISSITRGSNVTVVCCDPRNISLKPLLCQSLSDSSLIAISYEPTTKTICDYYKLRKSVSKTGESQVKEQSSGIGDCKFVRNKDLQGYPITILSSLGYPISKNASKQNIVPALWSTISHQKSVVNLPDVLENTNAVMPTVTCTESKDKIHNKVTLKIIVKKSNKDQLKMSLPNDSKIITNVKIQHTDADKVNFPVGICCSTSTSESIKNTDAEAPPSFKDQYFPTELAKTYDVHNPFGPVGFKALSKSLVALLQNTRCRCGLIASRVPSLSQKSTDVGSAYTNRLENSWHMLYNSLTKFGVNVPEFKAILKKSKSYTDYTQGQVINKIERRQYCSLTQMEFAQTGSRHSCGLVPQSCSDDASLSAAIKNSDPDLLNKRTASKQMKSHKLGINQLNDCIINRISTKSSDNENKLLVLNKNTCNPSDERFPKQQMEIVQTDLENSCCVGAEPCSNDASLSAATKNTKSDLANKTSPSTQFMNHLHGVTKPNDIHFYSTEPTDNLCDVKKDCTSDENKSDSIRHGTKTKDSECGTENELIVCELDEPKNSQKGKKANKNYRRHKRRPIAIKGICSTLCQNMCFGKSDDYDEDVFEYIVVTKINNLTQNVPEKVVYCNFPGNELKTSNVDPNRSDLSQKSKTQIVVNSVCLNPSEESKLDKGTLGSNNASEETLNILLKEGLGPRLSDTGTPAESVFHYYNYLNSNNDVFRNQIAIRQNCTSPRNPFRVSHNIEPQVMLLENNTNSGFKNYGYAPTAQNGKPNSLVKDSEKNQYQTTQKTKRPTGLQLTRKVRSPKKSSNKRDPSSFTKDLQLKSNKTASKSTAVYCSSSKNIRNGNIQLMRTQATLRNNSPTIESQKCYFGQNCPATYPLSNHSLPNKIEMIQVWPKNNTETTQDCSLITHPKANKEVVAQKNYSLLSLAQPDRKITGQMCHRCGLSPPKENRTAEEYNLCKLAQPNKNYIARDCSQVNIYSNPAWQSGKKQNTDSQIRWRRHDSQPYSMELHSGVEVSLSSDCMPVSDQVSKTRSQYQSSPQLGQETLTHAPQQGKDQEDYSFKMKDTSASYFSLASPYPDVVQGTQSSQSPPECPCKRQDYHSSRQTLHSCASPSHIRQKPSGPTNYNVKIIDNNLNYIPSFTQMHPQELPAHEQIDQNIPVGLYRESPLPSTPVQAYSQKNWPRKSELPTPHAKIYQHNAQAIPPYHEGAPGMCLCPQGTSCQSNVQALPLFQQGTTYELSGQNMPFRQQSSQYKPFSRQSAQTTAFFQPGAQTRPFFQQDAQGTAFFEQDTQDRPCYLQSAQAKPPYPQGAHAFNLSLQAQKINPLPPQAPSLRAPAPHAPTSIPPGNNYISSLQRSYNLQEIPINRMDKFAPNPLQVSYTDDCVDLNQIDLDCRRKQGFHRADQQCLKCRDNKVSYNPKQDNRAYPNPNQRMPVQQPAPQSNVSQTETSARKKIRWSESTCCCAGTIRSALPETQESPTQRVCTPGSCSTSKDNSCGVCAGEPFGTNNNNKVSSCCGHVSKGAPFETNNNNTGYSCCGFVSKGELLDTNNNNKVPSCCGHVSKGEPLDTNNNNNVPSCCRHVSKGELLDANNNNKVPSCCHVSKGEALDTNNNNNLPSCCRHVSKGEPLDTNNNNKVPSCCRQVPKAGEPLDTNNNNEVPSCCRHVSKGESLDTNNNNEVPSCCRHVSKGEPLDTNTNNNNKVLSCCGHISKGEQLDTNNNNEVPPCCRHVSKGEPLDTNNNNKVPSCCRHVSKGEPLDTNNNNEVPPCCRHVSKGEPLDTNNNNKVPSCCRHVSKGEPLDTNTNNNSKVLSCCVCASKGTNNKEAKSKNILGSCCRAFWKCIGKVLRFCFKNFGCQFSVGTFSEPDHKNQEQVKKNVCCHGEPISNQPLPNNQPH